MNRVKRTNVKVREIIIKQYHKGKSMQDIPISIVINIIKKYCGTTNIDLRVKSSGK